MKHQSFDLIRLRGLLTISKENYKKPKDNKKVIQKLLDDNENRGTDIRFKRLSMKHLKNLNQQDDLARRLEDLKSCNSGQDQHYFKKAWAIYAQIKDEMSEREITEIVARYVGDMKFMAKLCQHNNAVVTPAMLVESLLLNRGTADVLEFVEYSLEGPVLGEFRQLVEQKIGLDQFYKKQLLYCIQNLKDIKSNYKVSKKKDDFNVRIRLLDKLFGQDPVRRKTIEFLSKKITL